jgi:anti-sigma factor RsiW
MTHLTADDMEMFMLGHLPPAEAEQVQSHLNECATCAQRYQEEKGIARAMNAGIRQHREDEKKKEQE